MKIDGRAIAFDIYHELRKKTRALKARGVTPHIVVILIGDNPASESYVRQKRKWAEYIGGLFSFVHYPSDVTLEEVLQSVQHLNNNPEVHGVIIQRPLPAHLDDKILSGAVLPEKDIDGFHVDTPYIVPVANAVVKMLEVIYHSAQTDGNFIDWLKSKSVVVIGKGRTAGGPIIAYLQKKGIHPEVISSKTEKPEQIIGDADIIVSAVGKAGVVTSDMIKKDVILLGVGMHKGEDQKMHGDYDGKEVAEKASYFTPVIGGIGPVNVAYLLSNLVNSAENSAK